MVAEVILRTEIPQPSLVDLLELTALIALKDPKRHSRVAARWLERWLAAAGDATIYDVTFAAAALQQLGGRHHEKALAALRDMAEEPSRRRTGRSVA